MPALRKFTFSCSGKNTGVIEETAVGHVWLGAFGYAHTHLLLKPEDVRPLIAALRYFEQHGRLPENVLEERGVIPQ